MNISALSIINDKNNDASSFWWIDKKLLTIPKASYESLAMSAPVATKLNDALADVTKNLIEKNDYIFSKLKDSFPFRMRLEQMFRAVQNSKVSWESLAQLDVLGFDFISCQARITNMTQMATYIGTSIQRNPIETVNEMPNLSDDDVVVSMQDLKMTVNARKVKFFANTTKKTVFTAVDNLIAFDKSMEAMAGYAGRVQMDSKTYAEPIKNLTKNETVEVNDVHDAVDSINKRITTTNHLLNALFLLQVYNKIMNVVFTDAISNLKEG